MEIYNMRIKEARKAARMTQAELANRINVSQQTVARYESGEIDISLDKLIEISEVLNVSALWLMGRGQDTRFDMYMQNMQERPLLETLFRLARQLKDSQIESLIAVSEAMLK